MTLLAFVGGLGCAVQHPRAQASNPHFPCPIMPNLKNHWPHISPSPSIRNPSKPVSTACCTVSASPFSPNNKLNLAGILLPETIFPQESPHRLCRSPRSSGAVAASHSFHWLANPSFSSELQPHASTFDFGFGPSPVWRVAFPARMRKAGGKCRVFKHQCAVQRAEGACGICDHP